MRSNSFCVHQNCETNRLPISEQGHLFCFPRDEKRRQMWCKQLNRLDLLQYNFLQFFNKGFRVCRLHFNDNQFQTPEKKKLNFGQIPLSVLGHVPESRISNFEASSVAVNFKSRVDNHTLTSSSLEHTGSWTEMMEVEESVTGNTSFNANSRKRAAGDILLASCSAPRRCKVSDNQITHSEEVTNTSAMSILEIPNKYNYSPFSLVGHSGQYFSILS